MPVDKVFSSGYYELYNSFQIRCLHRPRNAKAKNYMPFMLAQIKNELKKKQINYSYHPIPHKPNFNKL
jgi:hypothetical protein